MNTEDSFSCNLYCIVAKKNDENIYLIFTVCRICVFPCDIGKVLIYLNLLSTYSGKRTFFLYNMIQPQ